MPSIEWQWCRLDTLSTPQQYAIFAAREAVFVVEQKCAYQDLDGLDLNAHHLVAWAGTEVAAYLRVLTPGVKYDEPAIGRVLTMASFRGSGLGRQLMLAALDHVAASYPGQSIRISAQSYLDRFYRSFGFVPCSTPYLEDGIPHIEMLRRGPGPVLTSPATCLFTL